MAHVANDKRRSWPPNLIKSTQLAIKKGKLTNRNASNQKNDEDSRIRANARVLNLLATLRRTQGEHGLATMSRNLVNW
jgi:hypothetical protein